MERSMITAGEITDPLPKVGALMDVEAFRAEFPVFERRVYMNTGTDGRIPARGFEAARAERQRALEHGGAGKEHWESIKDQRTGLRERIARLMGFAPAE